MIRQSLHYSQIEFSSESGFGSDQNQDMAPIRIRIEQSEAMIELR